MRRYLAHRARRQRVVRAFRELAAANRAAQSAFADLMRGGAR
jgi:hypothetical protein